MTTPERLKRRQMTEGIVLILLALLTTGQAIYFSQQGDAQQSCVERKFGQLSSALNLRAELADKETKAEHGIWFVYAQAAGAVKDPKKAKLSPKDQQKFNEQLIKALIHYNEVITKLQKQRREHPLPPYPVGACNQQ